MKKILVFISLLLIMTGCSLGSMSNTPTKKVEAYLNNYQSLDKDVMNDLDEMLKDSDYNVDQKVRYKEIMKKHYGDLKYEIKREVIDGDNAIVDTQVTVTDYSSIVSMEVNEDEYKDENGNYDITLFYDKQLDLFEKATDKVTYNITFNLIKEDNEWKIISLDENSIKKIHGVYVE